MRAAVIGSRHRPTASKFSMAKPMGSMRAWQLAQAGLARCSVIASRIVSGLPAPLPSVLSAERSAEAAGAERDSRFSSTHLPRNTGDVRLA